MSSKEWKKYKLEDVVDLKSGKSRPKDVGLYPVYGGNGILDYTNQFNASDETIIIGRVGAYCGSVYFENSKIWISDNALFAKSKEGFQSKFLYYYLKNRNLNTIAGGSSHPLLTQGQLNQIEVELPSMQTQQRIAAILSSLDDKIELNRQTNQTLEAIAQALFKEMCLPKGEELPEGWKVGKISEIGQVITGKTPSSNNPEHFGEKMPFVTPTDFKNYGKIIISAFRYLSQEGVAGLKNKLLPKNSVLVTCIGSDMGKVAINKVECVTNQQIKRLSPDSLGFEKRNPARKMVLAKKKFTNRGSYEEQSKRS